MPIAEAGIGLEECGLCAFMSVACVRPSCSGCISHVLKVQGHVA